jgi:site-specific recombinase XerD
MAKLKYILNKSRMYSNGEYPIFIRIQLKSVRKLVSVKKSILPEFWNDKKGEVILKSKSKEELRYLSLLDNFLKKKLAEYKSEYLILENNKPYYTISDLSDLIEEKSKSTTVFKFMEGYIERLEKAGKIGNSKAYKNTLGVFKKFRNEKDLTFDELSYKVLKRFEEDLQGKGRKVNAISFHMRTLRSIYNKAIKEEFAHQELYPFKDYRVKREKTAKRAIIKGNITLLKKMDLSKRPEYDKARDYFLFCFYTRGMSFIDLAHLKVSNIFNDRITYSRNKTNQKFTIKITPQISDIIAKYNDLNESDRYLFPIIIDPKGDIYIQYRNGMRLTNKKLKELGEELKLPVGLSTYVSRHSWATIAKREGVPTAVISEGLGHETERTTQIYLDSFENQVLDDANDLITNI